MGVHPYAYLALDFSLTSRKGNNAGPAIGVGRKQITRISDDLRFRRSRLSFPIPWIPGVGTRKSSAALRPRVGSRTLAGAPNPHSFLANPPP